MVVGRSELFTENFLVPIAGLNRESRASWLKLGELWVVSLALNVAGGVLLALLLTSRDVMPEGSGAPLVELSELLAGHDVLTSFWSAIVAGALMTLMTWFVEGSAGTAGVRIVMAWLVGFVVALGSFNHVVVSTVELFFGLRFGADVGFAELGENLGIAVAGNLVGGLAFVTFARATQALGGP